MKLFKSSPFTQWLILFWILLQVFGIHSSTGGDRARVIDFDDEVIEGMNKRPLDYLSQISERGGRKNKLHLYQKRAGFRNETKELLKEIRLFQ